MIPVTFFLIFAGLGCHRSKIINIPVDSLSEGDIIFRKGNGTKSQAVLTADTEGIYSHVGIIVKTDSGFMVVHVTPGERPYGEMFDKTKMERIEVFFAADRAKKGAILHFSDSLEYSVKAAQYAINFFQKEILFDFDYNLEDSTKMYCSELVWQSYMKAGRDITNQRRSEVRNFPVFSGIYIFPSDIYKNKYLSVYYEF